MKTLQPTELDKIRQELINQKVEYIEVIEELTDHIANGIEQQWSESNNNINFGEALTIELNKFGTKGLKKVQSEMNKAKTYEYLHIIGKGMKDCFTSSKVFYVLGIFISTLLLFNITSKWYFVDTMLNMLYITTIWSFIISIACDSKYNFKLTYLGTTKRAISKTYYTLMNHITTMISVVTALFLLSKKVQYALLSTNPTVWVVKSIVFTLLFVLLYVLFNNLRPVVIKRKNELSQTIVN